jgi:hypothetical protein
VLQVIGERGESGPNGGNGGGGLVAERIDQPQQMARFRPRLIQLLDVAGRAVALPGVSLAILVRGEREPALCQTKDEVARESAPRCGVVLSLAFVPRALQELLVPPADGVRG